MFKWGQFGGYSETGILRAISVTAEATNFMGIVGQHDQSMCTESLTLSHDKSTVVSYGQDQTLRFWNIEFLENMFVPVLSSKKRRNRNLQSSRQQDPRQFYNDLRT